LFHLKSLPENEIPCFAQHPLGRNDSLGRHPSTASFAALSSPLWMIEWNLKVEEQRTSCLVIPNEHGE
jgi:hypothetical protein